MAAHSPNNIKWEGPVSMNSVDNSEEDSDILDNVADALLVCPTLGGRLHEPIGADRRATPVHWRACSRDQ